MKRPSTETSDSAKGTDPLGRPRVLQRLPVWFQAPDKPVTSEPIRYQGVTPQRFTRRVILAAPKYTVPGSLLVIINMVCRALIPVIIGITLDRAVAPQDGTQLWIWLAVLALDFVVLTVSYRTGSRMGYYGMQQAQHRLRTTVTDALLNPRGTSHGQTDGQALTIATTDVFRLAATMQIGIYPVGQAASLIFCAVALTLISWPLGVAVGVGAVVLISAMFVAGSPLQRRTVEQQRGVAAAVGRAADLLSGYRVIKGLGAEAESQRRYVDASRQALSATLSAKAAQGTYTGSMNAITGVFTAALTVAAGLLTVNGSISVGGLVAAVGLIQFVVGPLTALPTHVGAVWASGLASARRVLGVLQAESGAAEPMPDGVGSPSAAAARCEAASPDGDTASRDGHGAIQPGTPTQNAENGILRLNMPQGAFTMRHGECVGLEADQLTSSRLVRALAGRTAELVPEVGDPQCRTTPGIQVTLDGASPEQTGPLRWRDRVLVAPHRAELFDGSIAENVLVESHSDQEPTPTALPTPGTDLSDTAQAFGEPPTNLDRVVNAMQAAACEDLLDAAGPGLDTPVGEGGTRLSGGQRQRLALARAYAADSEVLVLHEPTTAVDAATQVRIAERLRRARKGKTTLVITSSPALLAVCDRVVRPGADGGMA